MKKPNILLIPIISILITISFFLLVSDAKNTLQVFIDELPQITILAILIILTQLVIKHLPSILIREIENEEASWNKKHRVHPLLFPSLISVTILPISIFLLYEFIKLTNIFELSSNSIVYFFCSVLFFSFYFIKHMYISTKRKIALKNENEFQKSTESYNKGKEILNKIEAEFYDNGVANDQILKLCDDAIKLGIKETYRTRALLLVTLECYIDAIPDFNIAIEYDNFDSLAYLKRGICKGELGWHDEAINDISLAISIFRENDNQNVSLFNSAYKQGFYSTLDIYIKNLEYWKYQKKIKNTAKIEFKRRN